MDPNALLILIEDIKWGYDVFNASLDMLIPITCLIGISIVWALFTRTKIKNEGIGKGIYLGVLALLEAFVLILVLYFIPRTLANLLHMEQHIVALRWVVIYTTVIFASYFVSRKHGEKRGVVSALIILATFSLGWYYDQWIGVLFISTPLMVIYYHVVSKIAQVIYPTSNPDSQMEASLKTKALIVYLFGVQYPVWVPKSKDAREYEIVIDGDRNSNLGAPGIIWNASHQVAGITKGIEFNRVDGPGIVFTEKFEWPVSMVDLRTQLRVSVVNTVTKDGMEIPAVVFTAFAIDRDIWPKKDWSKAFFSKLKYLIGRDYEIDHVNGGHPYSSARVRSALGTVGINASNKADKEHVEIYWDEWVLTQVAYVTRQVISNRSLDELWRPKNDGLGSSALDEMADNLKKSLTLRLTEAGIQLFTVRIVNYELRDEKGNKVENGKEENTEKNHITQQNIKTWSSYWEQRVVETQADIEFIYREEIERAHAYSKSVLLSAIADSIQKARNIREDLPRHVIAQYFVHALEEYIKVLPGTDIKDSKQRIERIKEVMDYSTPEESE